MKPIHLFVCLLSAVMLASCGKQAVHITVTNDSEFPRQEVVPLSYAYIRTSLHLAPGETVVVRNMWWRRQPCQVSSDTATLFLSASVRKKGVSNYWIVRGRQPRFKQAVQGFLLPGGDFVWGNDRTSFRIGGADSPEAGSGIGLPGKPLAELAQGIAAEGGYSAAGSLGCGSGAPYAYGTLWTSGPFSSVELLEQGPVRLQFRLTYAPRLVADSLRVTETRVITLDAGSWLNRVEQTLEGTGGLAIGLGVVRHEGCLDFVQDKPDAYIGTWEAASAPGQYVAAGLVLPPQDRILRHYHKTNGVPQLDITKRRLIPEIDMTVSDGHALMLTPTPATGGLVFYAGGAFMEGRNASKEAWYDVLKRSAAAFEQPLHVGWK